MVQAFLAVLAFILLLRAFAAALTAIMHGEANATSALMARSCGTFDEYQKNREPMLNVMHRVQATA